MWIVAIAWIYVVGLMALTEHSIVAGIMTFLAYCVLPLSILFYLFGGRKRRARRDARAGASNETGSGIDSLSDTGDNSSSDSSSCDSGSSDSSCSDSSSSSD